MITRTHGFPARLATLVTSIAAALTLAGCAGDGSSSSYGGYSTSVSVGYGYGGYYGGGYYPGYYPGGYPPVVVVPPDRPGDGGSVGNRPGPAHDSSGRRESAVHETRTDAVDTTFERQSADRPAITATCTSADAAVDADSSRQYS